VLLDAGWIIFLVLFPIGGNFVHGSCLVRDG